jgi:uncharacterized protein YlzI (FlbEa/FlbD family)
LVIDLTEVKLVRFYNRRLLFNTSGPYILDDNTIKQISEIAKISETMIKEKLIIKHNNLDIVAKSIISFIRQFVDIRYRYYKSKKIIKFYK